MNKTTENKDKPAMIEVEVADLRELVRDYQELAEDYDLMMKEKYGSADHPSAQRRYNRDVHVVRKALRWVAVMQERLGDIP